MSVTILDSGLILKDPADIAVYWFDWGTTGLSAGASIVTSTFTVVGMAGDITTTPLTADQAAIVTGNRKTQIRLTAGALGSKWRIDNRILTDETPAQTKERSFFVKVENR